MVRGQRHFKIDFFFLTFRGRDFGNAKATKVRVSHVANAAGRKMRKKISKELGGESECILLFRWVGSQEAQIQDTIVWGMEAGSTAGTEQPRIRDAGVHTVGMSRTMLAHATFATASAEMGRDGLGQNGLPAGVGDEGRLVWGN